ncbi:MAG: YwiC-like family protein [Bacillota bacterium]
MKLLLPKQHGAWAMLIIPFILGIGAGEFTFTHIPLFIGWLFLYLATYPMLMFVKGKKKSLHLKWSVFYLFIALIFLITVLMSEWRIIMFGLAMLPFFLINTYFAKKKKERAFLNDVTAILAFCVGGVASYYLGTGSFDQTALFNAFLSFLFFLGSTFFVKTMIREKKNQPFRWLSWSYHILILICILWLIDPSLIVLAYVPSAIRAFVCNGLKLTIMQVGIWEIINSVYFLVVLLLLI